MFALADKGAENSAQRVHITLELAWSADATVQQLGRTHRYASGTKRSPCCCFHCNVCRQSRGPGSKIQAGLSLVVYPQGKTLLLPCPAGRTRSPVPSTRLCHPTSVESTGKCGYVSVSRW